VTMGEKPPTSRRTSAPPSRAWSRKALCWTMRRMQNGPRMSLNCALLPRASA
jgi:hypothetical protein